VLPVAGAWPAAGLVQVGAVPLARGHRSAWRARRLRGQPAGRHGDQRARLDRRVALPRDSDAAGGHRRLGQRPAREAGHSRFDDRHRPRAAGESARRRGGRARCRAGRTRCRDGGAAMNGVHDMGGMHGFGPVRPERDEPWFHAEWERRAFALALAMGATGSWTLDQSRAARESIPAATYLASSYYEIWLAALEALMRERGLVREDELVDGRVRTP